MNEVNEVFVLITETRHGDSTVYVFFQEDDALQAYDDFELQRQGDTKALYKKCSNSSYCPRIKYEE